MDLIFNAYSTASDDVDDGEGEDKHEPEMLQSPPPKRLRPQCPNHIARPSPPPHRYPTTLQTQMEAPIPGRYISKRERAVMGTDPGVCDPNPSPSVSAPLPSAGGILGSKLQGDIFSSLRNRLKATELVKISDHLPIALKSHQKAISSLQWSPSHAHLLASGGMDHTICIWNVWNRDQKKACVLNNHKAAVKDVKWSPQGLSLLSCGYDCTSRLTDVDRGAEKQVFIEDQVVGVVKFHPENLNLFLSGGSKGFLRLWDTRCEKVVHEYVRGLGPILDIEFMADAKQFISSSDVSGSNVSENSIVVWDVARQVPLSNQVYAEAYTCPCIRCHPFDPYFIAQSNGNYIAIFSSRGPFKLDKYRRFDRHGVCGFPIKCNFSLDGGKLVSGSSDGFIYVYNFRSGEVMRRMKVCREACTDVVFHPVLDNVIGACSWGGDIRVMDWDGTS